MRYMVSQRAGDDDQGRRPSELGDELCAGMADMSTVRNVCA
jgi:hypothetical protein